MHRAEPIRGTILSAAGLRSWRAPQGRGDEMDLNENTEKGKSWDFLFWDFFLLCGRLFFMFSHEVGANA